MHIFIQTYIHKYTYLCVCRHNSQQIKVLNDTNIKYMSNTNLTRSGLEWKRNSKIFVPIAPLGGSSKAVNARVDNTTFK